MPKKFLWAITVFFFLTASHALAAVNTAEKQKPQSNTRGTKKLFFMISLHYYTDEDFPKDIDPKKSVPALFRCVGPTEGKAFALATLAFIGKEKRRLVTLFVYTEKDGELKGWNIIKNKQRDGVTERIYVYPKGGSYAEMALSNAVYLVATEVPLLATEEHISPKELDALLQPTIDYLYSIQQ
ncbi:MAG: hypothetical protein G01um101470_704 [Parcubacteria group bacterium Gr01-1014_70]|nr:MAG: hypothetical protein G01um101470_704 [Parcubacteria group bacterium Gr01-1014_70]